MAYPVPIRVRAKGPITQGEDANYVQAVGVKFKSGKRERAIEIINEYFLPATLSAYEAPLSAGPFC
mgnify:CR=1 FL=1